MRARPRAKAYAPYSNFHVGCAIESVDGEVVTGANMENACYRLGVCAEQSALTAAQHTVRARQGRADRGRRRQADADRLHAMRRLPPGDPRSRRLLSGRDIEIICGSGDGIERIERHTHSDQLHPAIGFGPANLEWMPGIAR